MTQFLLKCTIAAAGIVFVAGFNSAANAQVTVDLSDEGALTIVGDKGRNFVTIDVLQQVTVWTTPFESYSFDVLSITSVNIKMGAGADWVRIRMFHPLFADISIDTGHALDRVILEEGSPGGIESSNAVVGNININTGHGDDSVWISSFAVWGDVDISTGNGRDWIVLNSFFDSTAFAGSNDILGDLSINTGVDTDNVFFENHDTNVGQDLTLELGQGNDTIWNSNLINQVGGSAFLSGGQGIDTCPVDLVTAAEIIKIGFEN